MHISDGILPGTVCIASAGAAVVLTAASLKKTSYDDIPKISVMTAAFFIASLIHLKVGPFSTHLLLNGLVGIILGTGAFPAIFVSLIFQALIFQHGGVTTLGVNSLAMGIPALIASFVFHGILATPLRNKKFLLSIAAFISAFLSVILSAGLLSFFLFFAGKQYYTTAKTIFAIHLPLAVIEGIITILIIKFLLKIKPEIVNNIHL